MTVVDPDQQPVSVGVCATCGKSITHPGPDGECMRCLVSFGFLAEGDKSQAVGERIAPGALRYAHFEVEINTDGFPKILGAGAMAVTYCARDTVLNSKVALKVITRKLAENPTARARFLREARAAAQIHHPNVARVIHYGEQDGECFYAMELVEGETLEARVQRDGALPLSTALEVVEQTARGLAAGEACGVIHRDLKPSNLMIESDPSGHLLVKIIDYGVAKVMAPDNLMAQTQTGFIGTPAFASPEQFDEAGRQQIDTRSDVYSLGTTFWYLLTGQTPFAGRSIEEIRARQTQQLPLHQLRAAHAPAQVIALLKSMLALDPGQRPATARALLSAVHRCNLQFEPAARRQRKRRRWAEVVMGLLVLATMAVAFFFASRKMTRPPLSVAPKSIAVLPFENRSGEKQNEYLADGVQDEILTDLAKIADLKVISRSSVMQYKGGVARNLRNIGEQLGVAHVLEGSVQRAANKIRVNAQLIDARTDTHIWAQTYDRDLADVFAIQSEIAKAIADQLQAKLSPNERAQFENPPTSDLVAFDLYTRAKTLILSIGFTANMQLVNEQAIGFLNQAVARDPTFVEAYYQLVYAHGYAYSSIGDHTPARLALAEAALEAAVRLRPDAGETHLARAQYLLFCMRNFNGALAELEAVRLSLPNDARFFELSGYVLRRLGKHDEAIRNLERAMELDPRNIYTLQQLAISYQFVRRYPETKAAFERVVAIAPDDVVSRIFVPAVLFNWKAETRPLHETIDSILRDNPDAMSVAANDWFTCALAERDPTAAERALVALGNNSWWRDGALSLGSSPSFGEGLLARMMKDEARAQAAFTKARLEQDKIVQAQPDHGPSLCVLAMIDAALGRKEDALREGRRAIELVPVEKDSITGSQMLIYFAVTAAWAGEKDIALQYLTAHARSPGGRLVSTYGALKLLPFWDPLRGDPRFEAFVQSLRPVSTK